MSFDSLGLKAEIVRAASEKGYTTPTPIQKQAIPAVLEGGDIMGGAQTGTGKTAGFTLPLLHLLACHKGDKGRRPVRALILTPTRELAAQVGESVKAYGKYLPLKCGVVYGGVKMGPQVSMLRRGVDVLVSTPGRLLDHATQKNVDLSSIEILVLDEADRMLDMGFITDVRKLIKMMPRQRQTLMFSATFSNEIKKLSDSFLKSPKLIEVAARNTSAETVEQLVHPVDRERKTELLAHLITEGNWRQVLVFTRTKHGANRLAEKLDKDGIRATAIHGNKTQAARIKALARFKEGSVRVLVATEIAARGLDINQLPHVVNFELPTSAEDYIHRIGRTGRAGTKGEAISLVCVDERKLLRDIEGLLKRKLPKKMIPNYEPDPSIRPEPILRVRGPRLAPRTSAGKPNSRAGYKGPRSPGGHGSARKPHRGGGKPAGRSNAGQRRRAK